DRSSWLTLIFFSSRRRHTRSKRDWSSDVCSSDLWKTLKLRALADPEELERFPAKRAATGQRRLDPFPHRCHLARHAGHRDDPLAILWDVPARRRAVRIRRRTRRWDEPRLFAVAVGHDHAAAREPRDEIRLQGGVDSRGLAEGRGDRFSGQIVFGRPEPASRDDEIATRERSVESLLGAGQIAAKGLHGQAA